MLKNITLTCTITREDFSFSKIYRYLDDVEIKYDKLLEDDPYLPAELREALADKVLDVLNLVGEMSQPLFNKRVEIEDRWHRTCLDAEKAKWGWIDEYIQLHRPYDRLKNRAYYLFCKINNIPDHEL
jgi:hypothetical protein